MRLESQIMVDLRPELSRRARGERDSRYSGLRDGGELPDYG